MIGKRLESLDLELFVKATNFFAEALGIKDSPTMVSVNIVDNIGTGDVAGVCIASIKDEEVSSIEIKIKQTITVFGMIEALAHEMVHAEQFLNKKLTFEYETRYLFGIFPYKRRIKTWKNSYRITGLDYHSEPSEVEAFLKQRILTVQFMKIVEDELMPSNVFKHIMQDRKDSSTYSALLNIE